MKINYGNVLSFRTWISLFLFLCTWHQLPNVVGIKRWKGRAKKDRCFSVQLSRSQHTSHLTQHRNRVFAPGTTEIFILRTCITSCAGLGRWRECDSRSRALSEIIQQPVGSNVEPTNQLGAFSSILAPPWLIHVKIDMYVCGIHECVASWLIKGRKKKNDCRGWILRVWPFGLPSGSWNFSWIYDRAVAAFPHEVDTEFMSETLLAAAWIVIICGGLSPTDARSSAAAPCRYSTIA